MVSFKVPIVKNGTVKEVNIIANVILADNVLHVIKTAMMRILFIELISFIWSRD